MNQKTSDYDEVNVDRTNQKVDFRDKLCISKKEISDFQREACWVVEQR